MITSLISNHQSACIWQPVPTATSLLSDMPYSLIVIPVAFRWYSETTVTYEITFGSEPTSTRIEANEACGNQSNFTYGEWSET